MSLAALLTAGIHLALAIVGVLMCARGVADPNALDLIAGPTIAVLSIHTLL